MTEATFSRVKMCKWLEVAGSGDDFCSKLYLKFYKENGQSLSHGATPTVGSSRLKFTDHTLTPLATLHNKLRLEITDCIITISYWVF